MIQNDSPAILWEMHSLLDKAEQNLLFMNRMQQWGQNAPNFHQLFFLDIQLQYNSLKGRHKGGVFEKIEVKGLALSRWGRVWWL